MVMIGCPSMKVELETGVYRDSGKLCLDRNCESGIMICEI